MFGIGHFPELIIVLVVALVIFGPGKLPEIGKSLGQGIRYFRQSTSELERTFAGAFEDTPVTPPPTTGAQAVATAGGELEQPQVVAPEPAYQAPSYQTETIVHPAPPPMEPPMAHTASTQPSDLVAHASIPPVEAPTGHAPVSGHEAPVAGAHAPIPDHEATTPAALAPIAPAVEAFAPVVPLSAAAHVQSVAQLAGQPSTTEVVTAYEEKSVAQSETPGIAVGASFQTAFAPVVEEPALSAPAPASNDALASTAAAPKQRTRRVRKVTPESPAPAQGDLPTPSTSTKTDSSSHTDTIE